MKKTKNDAISIVILVILSTLFFAHLFYPYPKIFATAEIGINDIWDFNFPLKNFLSESLKMGKLPLWNPYRAGGFPDFAESQVGALNLYNLLAFKFFSPITAFNLGYIIIFTTSAVGTYLFARRQKFSHHISIYAGFLYAFSGFFTTHISHFLLIQAASFFPWIAYFTDKLLKDKSRLVFSFSGFCFFISQQIFSGNPQTVFITVMGVIFLTFYNVLTRQTRFLNLALLTVAAITGLVLSAVQLLPTLELMRLSSRGLGLDPREILFYKFPLQHLITFIFPFWFGNPQLGTYPHFRDFNGSIFWENTGYIGIIPLFFVPLGFLYKKQRRQVLFYSFLLLVSLLLMLGGDGPLYFILLLPGFSFFRFPSRFMLLFLFCLVFLSAFGLQYADASLRKKGLFLRVVLSILEIGAILQLFAFWYAYHPTVPFDQFAASPPVEKYLETVSHGKIYTYLQNARAWSEFFRSGSTLPNRYLQLRNELVPNLNVYYHEPTSDVYSSLIPRRLAFYNQPLASSYQIATESSTLDNTLLTRLNLRNTTHILSPIPLLNLSLVLEKQFHLDPPLGEIYLYKNKAALPKYYFVNQFKIANTLEDLTTLIDAKKFIPEKEVLVEKDPVGIYAKNPLESSIQAKAEKTDMTLLEVKTNQNAILVITNTYYPGWEAQIDGKPTEIFPVNLVNQGVFVPNGNHEIKLTFYSKTVTAGLWITGIGYTLVALGLIIKLLSTF